TNTKVSGYKQSGQLLNLGSKEYEQWVNLIAAEWIYMDKLAGVIYLPSHTRLKTLATNCTVTVSDELTECKPCEQCSPITSL
ncbi:MAG: hypothetical protein ACPG5T_05265, partial [Endozoicomonas sp.]